MYFTAYDTLGYTFLPYFSIIIHLLQQFFNFQFSKMGGVTLSVKCKYRFNRQNCLTTVFSAASNSCVREPVKHERPRNNPSHSRGSLWRFVLNARASKVEGYVSCVRCVQRVEAISNLTCWFRWAGISSGCTLWCAICKDAGGWVPIAKHHTW